MNNKIVNLPFDAESYHQMAEKKMKLQQYNEAIPFLQKALELKRDKDYLYDLTECYALTKQIDKAEPLIFEQIIKETETKSYFKWLSQLYTKVREPNKAFLYGLYYVQLTDDQEYMDDLTKTFDVVYHDKKAVEKESALYVSQQIFQYLFSNGRIHEAIDWLNNQPIHLQERKEMRNLKAMALLFVSRYKEAEILLLKLLDEDETDIHALCHYTLLLYNKQDERYAYYLQRLNKLHPINEDESFKLGIVLSFLKQYEASQALLLPIYRKHHMNNAQLLHALSFNYYALGEVKISEDLWKNFQSIVQSKALSPKAIDEGQKLIDATIWPLIEDEDSQKRQLGIFYLSQIPQIESMISKEMWDAFERLSDYDKLYLSYIFHKLELIKLDFMHKGLCLLFEQCNDEELLLRWIDVAEQLIEEIKPFDQLNAYVSAVYYLYLKADGQKISKTKCTQMFNTTTYQLNKSLKVLEQNNI